ncbi:MAG: type VI secretion system baseplate subunit TssK, partial [Gammaproteobacteria bacterium]|nr:type VI secretion system baseplate subunit TssK [Gammaproteobacteria bacterium]
NTFKPVIQYLRKSFSAVYEQSAISLTFVERNYGIRVAEISDHSLIESSTFVLAVKADVATDVILSRFNAQVKLGPVERIRQLVNAQMPGIVLKPLSVAPRQIPFHSGFTYFQLEENSPYWKEMKQSGGFALHVGGEFPGLEIEFWAIRV